MNRPNPTPDCWTDLLRATEALLEARANQMVTEQEWSSLRDAVVACGGRLPQEEVHDQEPGAN